MTAQSGADGILDHVAADRDELLLVLDRTAPEPLAEEMAPASVARVEALRVAAVQPLEPGRQLGDGRLEDEVVVVGHQAERVHAPVVFAHRCCEQAQEDPAVVVVPVDRDLSGTTRRHVKEAVEEDVSRQPRHPLQGRPRAGRPASLWTRNHTSDPQAEPLPAMSGDCPQTWPLETWRGWPAPRWPVRRRGTAAWPREAGRSTPRGGRGCLRTRPSRVTA
jgi:hypothetical protein